VNAVDKQSAPLAKSESTTQARPSLAEAFPVWLKIGLLSFGGPAGQIALMHRLLVEERRWVSEPQFLHALNFCMLLPGPEAQQLATYVGWLMHGTRGGLIAGTLFVLPGAMVILALSVLYALFNGVPLLAAIFLGIKAAVLVIVIEAVMRIGRKVLKNMAMVLITVAAFIGIFAFALPFPIIVLSAAAIGFVGARLSLENFGIIGAADEQSNVPSASPSLLRSTAVLFGGLVLWSLPILLAAFVLGSDHVFVTEGLFFSKLATVTFGGAYAVLAYMAQEAVVLHGWLSAGEMIDGLGLAESTPGPLIMVTQFVGFLGALRNPGSLEPMTAAVLGSALTVWVTFVPCFLWIFLGAPYVERLRGNVQLSGALSAITAAVVGVILNLALWFGMHVLFNEVTTFDASIVHIAVPTWSSVVPVAAILVITAALALLRFKLSVIKTLTLCAALSYALSLVM
jgi:chromate transporter